MSIERMRNFIIESAQKEADQIIKTAEEQFRTEIESTKLSLEKEYCGMLDTEEDHLKEDVKRMLSSLKSDYKMRLLEIKNRVIDDVLERALNRIQSLADNDYLALIGKWLSNIPPHLEGQLFINTRDLKRITDVFIDSINKNRKTKIILGTNAIDIKGGFILKTEHFEVDYSLDTIVRNLRSTLIPELGNILQFSHVDL